jgi:hypothetical protein
MAENAYVSWAVRDRPWKLEDELIGALDLPLNLQGNRYNRFHSVLTELRARCVAQAKTLPVVPNPRTGAGAGSGHRCVDSNPATHRTYAAPRRHPESGYEQTRYLGREPAAAVSCTRTHPSAFGPAAAAPAVLASDAVLTGSSRVNVIGSWHHVTRDLAIGGIRGCEIVA